MTALPTVQGSHLLMQALEKKVSILISQSMVTALEISQLQQENARLTTQLAAHNTATEKLNHL
jgi:hypothetical protein